MIVFSLLSLKGVEAMEEGNQFNELSRITGIEPYAGNPTSDPVANRIYNQVSNREYEEIESTVKKDYSSRVIVGEDTRTQVFDISDHDYRTVARIVSTYPNGQSTACSSTLVSENMILTNAHCVYSADRGGLALTVTVTPGQTSNINQGRPFGTVRSSNINVPDNWITTQNRNYDYAIVQLQQPIGYLTGWKGLATNVTVNDITQHIHSSAGYPGDKPTGTMWVDHGNVWFESNQNNLLYHNLSTMPGSSGSGVYRKFDNMSSNLSYIIAVHAAGLVNGRANIAVNLTDTAFTNTGEEVINWINQGRYNYLQ